MSTTLNYPATQTPTRKAPARKYAGYLIFILCASLYLLPFMRVFLGWPDEGLLVAGAARIAHGQVFARDFIEIMGPGTFYWLALFFKLFGVTFLATRICLFVSSLGTGLLLYFLSRRICDRYQILPPILLAGTYFGGLWPTISHHVDSNFFALLSVALILVWQEKRNSYLLAAAGVSAGVTTCILQPKGVLLLAALLLWLSTRYLRRAVSLSSLAQVCAGYISVLGSVLVYFWSRHALWDLVYANFVWPSQHYGGENVVPYAQGLVLVYWNGWAGTGHSAAWRTGLAALLILPLVLIAALPALVPILGLGSRKNTAKPEIFLYWLCAWALWFSEFHRRDIYHLVFGSLLLLVLCVYYLGRYRSKIADLALQVLAISAVSLAGFNLVLALTAHSTTTRAGTVAMFKIDPVLAALEKRVAPGEEIFVYPYSPMYYFLSETTNPTYYTGLIYNASTPQQFQEVVRTLDEHRVRYVVWDTGFQERSHRWFFPSVESARPDQLIIEPYLESHYQTVWTDHNGTLLMERKSEYR